MKEDTLSVNFVYFCSADILTEYIYTFKNLFFFILCEDFFEIYKRKFELEKKEIVCIRKFIGFYFKPKPAMDFRTNTGNPLNQFYLG